MANSKTSNNDTNDALSTAIAGIRRCGLCAVRSDGHAAVLPLLADRHHDPPALRTQAVCRMHVLFRELVAGGARFRISAAHTRELITTIEPIDPVGRERVRLAGEHLADIERLNADIAGIKERIAEYVTGPTPCGDSCNATAG